MNSQEYYLNIRPGDGYPQTVKVSQGDVGRPLLFHLMDGVNPLSIPAGATITIHGTKPSGLGFTETCTVSGSSAAISTTLDITQEYGLFPAELVVSANDDIIATANFSLFVERSPHPDGTTDGTKEELDDLYTEVANLKEDVANLDGLSDDAKNALLQIAQKVAYIDDDGATYYQALYDALYPPTQTFTVTNTLTGCTTSNVAASVTENTSYSATITASSGYTLTGATVSVTMGGTDITATAYNNGTISIASVTGNLSITVTAVAVTLSSISAVYTQSGTVLDTDSLDSLKSDLVVTATYSDSSSETVASADYTLSGTLAEGTSTITVTYESKTTTFTVTVSISLDSIAYGTLTYRQLFITNNLVVIGDFETTLTLDNNWHVISGTGFSYKKNAGSPAQSTEAANSPTHSLKCFGTGSTQVAYSNQTNSYSQKYLCCVDVKVDRYSAGKAGLQVVTPLQNSIEQSNVCVEAVTSGFTPVVKIHEPAASRTGMGIYMGTYSSANCDAYVDDIVVTPLPDGLTEADGLTLYTKYLELRRTA